MILQPLIDSRQRERNGEIDSFIRYNRNFWGMAKAITQSLNQEEREEVIKRMESWEEYKKTLNKDRGKIK